MAKSKKNENPSEQPEGFDGTRLKKLVVKNFRCIGNEGVAIDLDRIVVLVGPNNVGKSSILRAYELVMSSGTLTEDDLPNRTYSQDKPPIVELHTWVDGSGIGEQWINLDGDMKYIIERWVWGQDLKPKRQGFDAIKGDFVDEKPIGFDNVAAARRPKPHRIIAFASPDAQSDQVAKLIQEWLKEKASDSTEPGGMLETFKSAYAKAVEGLRETTKNRTSKAEDQLSSLIAGVFPGYSVQIDVTGIRDDEALVETLVPTPTLRMGPKGEHMALVRDQGSGAQRALLWAALKLIAEEGKPKAKGKKKTARSTEEQPVVSTDNSEQQPKRNNVLLIDEPELCLHPNAVREACRTLYDLANEVSGWQVMVTTHSPVFIDFSREHTTVARVERIAGTVKGTTIFRPSKVALTQDEQELLKLLNIWDPYVAEFFFGGSTVVVEGDTEYSVFREIISKTPSLRHAHVVRARGKAIIVPLAKILNQFGARYSILHDSDEPVVKTKNGMQRNGMWTENGKILEEVAKGKAKGVSIRLVAARKNFEVAVFGEMVEKEKPYVAWEKVRTNKSFQEKAALLLEGLLDHAKSLPKDFLEWDNLDKLEQDVKDEMSNTATK